MEIMPPAFRLKIFWAFLAAFLPAFWTAPPPATASDHFNLEEGLPVQVEDAYPTPYRNREVQLQIGYERTGEGDDRFVIRPRLELGLAPDLQAEINVPVFIGSADRAGSGDIRLGLLYNLNQEGLYLPAFAMAGRVDVPTGYHNDGVDTVLKFITTKKIPWTSRYQAFHINVAWIHNEKPRENERRDRYQAVLGYSLLVGTDTFLVADFIREEQREKNKESNIFEAGFRYQWSPLTVLSAGAGFGVGDNSPDIRIILGIQRSLTF